MTDNELCLISIKHNGHKHDVNHAYVNLKYSDKYLYFCGY
jgi:hypothetical protein